MLPRLFLLASRFSLAALVGLVGRRFLGREVAELISFINRDRACALFFIWLRDCCALMTIIPPSVMRLSFFASSLFLHSSGRDDAAISKRRCIALLTLLTFCPPAPCARIAENSTSCSLMLIVLLMMISTVFCRFINDSNEKVLSRVSL